MYQRMRRLYQWKSLVKRSDPDSRKHRVPQLNGLPGWLLLTQRPSTSEAVALSIDEKGGHQEELKLVMDERMCCDTIFRTTRLSNDVFVINDVWAINGLVVHPTSTWTQRQEWIAECLRLFHQPDLTALFTLEDAPVGTLVRGYEYYDDVPGSIGVFSREDVNGDMQCNGRSQDPQAQDTQAQA
jgi:hypothetical protein